MPNLCVRGSPTCFILEMEQRCLDAKPFGQIYQLFNGPLHSRYAAVLPNILRGRTWWNKFTRAVFQVFNNMCPGHIWHVSLMFLQNIIFECAAVDDSHPVSRRWRKLAYLG